MTMNNQPDQVENVQQFTAILQVRQYYINDNEQPARAGRKCPAVYSHSTGKTDFLPGLVSCSLSLI
jgi:hypothetical protein